MVEGPKYFRKSGQLDRNFRPPFHSIRNYEDSGPSFSIHLPKLRQNDRISRPQVLDFFATFDSSQLACRQPLAARTTEFFATLPGICAKWRIISPPSSALQRRKPLPRNRFQNLVDRRFERIIRHGANPAGELIAPGRSRLPRGILRGN
jgi:hypothetical protein